MENFRKKLLRQKGMFNRRARKLIIFSGIVLLLAAAALVTAVRHSSDYTGADGRRIVIDRDAHRFTTVSAGKPGDAAQLLMPEDIAPDAVGTIVVRDGVRSTAVDIDVLEKILGVIQNIPQEELRLRADESIKWEDFQDANRRDRIMGRVCSFRGTLRRLEENDSVEFPALGIDRLYEGQIQDAPGRWFSFYVIEKPQKPIERFDLTEITGVFYKLIVYPTRGGEDMVTPLIVGRTLESEREHHRYRGRFQRFASTASPWVFYPAIIAIPLVLCLLAHLLLKRNSARRTRRRR